MGLMEKQQREELEVGASGERIGGEPREPPVFILSLFIVKPRTPRPHTHITLKEAKLKF